MDRAIVAVFRVEAQEFQRRLAGGEAGIEHNRGHMQVTVELPFHRAAAYVGMKRLEIGDVQDHDPEKANHEAKALLADYQKKLDAAQLEVRGILDEARRDAENAKQATVAEARAEAAAEGAHHGSRGNSGGILGQILQGFSQSLSKKATLTTHALAQALRTFDPHIFHFIGHGMNEGGQGFAILEDEAGQPALVRGHRVVPRTVLDLSLIHISEPTRPY